MFWPLCLLVASAVLVATANDLQAHLALQSASPAAGDTLVSVPREVVLTFTEEIDLPLSSVVLTGPTGTVALEPITVSPAGTELRVGIAGALTPGSYRIEWQAVGQDGHPVRGESEFEIAPGAEGLPVPAAPVVEPPPPPPPPPSVPPASEFSTESPLYAGVRWVNYLGIIASIGSVAFLMLLRSASGSGDDRVLQSFTAAASRGTVLFGLLATGLLAASIILRLEAQSHAVLGAGISGTNLRLLLSSDWGSALLTQLVGGAILAAGLVAALRTMTVGLPVAAIGALILAASPAMSSHAAAVPRLKALAMVSDSLHVLGAGAWLGSLLVFVFVGVSHLRRVEPSNRSHVYARLLRTFSALALTSGAVIVATGLFAATLQLNGLADFLNTRYGNVLAAKLVLVTGVFAVGAINWRRLPRHQEEANAVGLFRRRAGVELVIAVLVVAATAVLVAVPSPSHELPAAAMNSNTWSE